MSRDSSRPRSKRPLLITAGAIVAVAAIAASFMLLRTPAPSEAGPQPVDVKTVQVKRGDLVEQIRAHGKLAYSTPHSLGSSLEGTVTALPPVGTTVTRGQELMRIDNTPVVLLIGTVPAWRSFESGMTPGPDVQQLEENLAELGFLSGTADDTFDWVTRAAISAWQQERGIAQTGTLELGVVHYAPGDLRIHSHSAALGDPAGPEIIEVTGAVKQIDLLVDPAQQSLVPVGAEVSVSLPDGTSTVAKVAAVGSPVEKESATGTSLKLPVTLTLLDPPAAANFDSVSVSVSLTSVREKDVLLLPVSALLAQPGGGFAVDVLTPQKKQSKPQGAKKPAPGPSLTPVELGTFADGFVAVTGGKLAEGDRVVVAK